MIAGPPAARRRESLRWVAGLLVIAACARTPEHGTSNTRVSEAEAAAAAAAPPVVDHHQHLFSPAGVELIGDTSQHPITAARLVAMLDEAGIGRAVVLSEAFWFDSRPAGLENPGPLVRAENEWTVG